LGIAAFDLDKRLRSAVGLSPKKLPIQIVRWGGIARHLLSSHEPVWLAGAAFTNSPEVLHEAS
jgi:hypothetical protein